MGSDSKYVKYVDGIAHGALVLAWLTCAIMFVALLAYRPAHIPERDYFLYGLITLLPLAWFGRKWIGKVLGGQ